MRLNTTTFGLKRHVNQFTEFQCDHLHAFLDSSLNAASDADIFAPSAIGLLSIRDRFGNRGNDVTIAFPPGHRLYLKSTS